MAAQQERKSPAQRDILLQQGEEADRDLIEQLVWLRKSKALTQQVVADRMGRDRTAISGFERLGLDPHMSSIRRYAAAIGVVVTHTITDTEEAWNAEKGPHPEPGEGLDG